MATQRHKRLEKLVLVMNRLKAVHEAQHATYSAQALNADKEAREIAARIDDGNAISALFPDLYHRHIGNALQRKEESSKKARKEAEHVLAANMRMQAVERAYREIAALEERREEDKLLLEFVERASTKSS